LSINFYVFQKNKLTIQSEIHFPHSLGLLYSAITYYTGFKVNSGEYKVMGLAPYGEPKYAQLIKDHLIDIKEDGSFRLDMSYFNYCTGLTMTNQKFNDLFGGAPRSPESEITQKEMDKIFQEAWDNSFGKMGINSQKYREGRGVTTELPKVKNNHPTLKPISLSKL
jgi:predicted NodU family carbamoyl transferase